MITCKLNTILAEKGLKITKVSKDTGISRTTLTALTQNHSQGIQLDTLDTLCNYLNITPSDLFKREIHIPSEPQKSILETLNFYYENVRYVDNSCAAGEAVALAEVLWLLEGAQEFDCGLYANYEAVIKGKCSERNTIVELPPNYKLIVVKLKEPTEEE